MKNIVMISALCFGLFAQGAAAQYGGGRREGGMGGAYGRPALDPAPPLPGAVMEGTSGLGRGPERSGAVRFPGHEVHPRPTKPSWSPPGSPATSAQVATDKMNDRLATGDRAAATFYAQRLQDIGKSLRDRQDKFDDGLRAFLTKDQQKAYKKWEDDAERVAQERNKEAGLRWQEAGGFGGGHEADLRALVESGEAPAAALGSQAVRVGRAIYISAQLGQDSTGALVGADLTTQARQAFHNVTSILKRATASPGDVVRLTIYVVNPDSGTSALLRSAGADYFAGRAQPATAILACSRWRNRAR